jgi:hypothetical protein
MFGGADVGVRFGPFFAVCGVGGVFGEGGGAEAKGCGGERDGFIDAGRGDGEGVGGCGVEGGEEADDVLTAAGCKGGVGGGGLGLLGPAGEPVSDADVA